MAAVGIRIYLGPDSGSLTLIDKSPVAPLQIGRQEQTKNKVTWHGHRNVAVLGQRKKVYTPTFTKVPSSIYATVSIFGLASRKWYCRITDRLGTVLFERYVFCQLANEEIVYVTDTDYYFNFQLLLFEV